MVQSDSYIYVAYKLQPFTSSDNEEGKPNGKLCCEMLFHLV